MPVDVAMEGTDPRVIGLVLDDEVARLATVGAAGLEQLDVAPLRVLDVLHGAVPGADAFGEDVEVVSVEVHGVGGGEVVADDDADGGVGAEVVDVPLGVEGVGEVALVGEDEEGGAEGGVSSEVRRESREW